MPFSGDTPTPACNGQPAMQAQASAGGMGQYSLRLPAWFLDEEEGLGSSFGESEPYHAEKDVILRLEVISSGQCKALGLLSFSAITLATMALVFEVVVKLKKDPEEVLITDHSKYFVWGLSVACVLQAMLLFVIVTFVRRLAEALRSGRRWSRRRKRIALLAFAQLLVQTLNGMVCVVMNAYILSRGCTWSNMTVVMCGWAHWTLWNLEFLIIIAQGHSGNTWHGGKYWNEDHVSSWALRAVRGLLRCKADSQPVAEAKNEKARDERQGQLIVLDAPITIHAPKLILWGLMEVAVCLLTANLSRITKGNVSGTRNCETVKFTCTPDTRTQTTVGLLVFFVGIYLLVYVVHIFQTFRQLRQRPYQQSKLSNVLFRIQAQQVTYVFITLALSVALLLLLKLPSCWTFIFAWFGVLPMQLAASSMAIVTSWYFMPKNPAHEDQILQAWLQEFAWTERSLPGCLAQRNRHLAKSTKLSGKPMFCVETALRLLYWTCLVYDYEEVPSTPFDINFALKLYGLEGHDLLWDRVVDIKALLGWSRERNLIVIAFRGTASFENIKTDLKLWQVVLPPKRRAAVSSLWGLRRMHRVVKVHSGFYSAWAGTPSPPAEGSSGSKAGLGPAPLQPGAAVGAKVADGPAGGEVRLVVPGPSQEGASRQGQQGQQGLVALAAPCNQQLLLRVESILQEQGMQPESVTFVLTGHSLGGAIASLAALDMRERWPQSKLRVYTYGQPRVGNAPFAREYNALIPHHMSVINDQDPVPRVPKSTYKRCGQRVIVNGAGDMIVNPTYLESSTLKSTGVVGDHLLERYRASFAAVLKAQFAQKGLPGGEEGVRDLCSQVDLGQLLLCEGLDLESLGDESKRSITIEALEKLKQQRVGLQGMQELVRPLFSPWRAASGSCCSGPPPTVKELEEGAEEVTAGPTGGGPQGSPGVVVSREPGEEEGLGRGRTVDKAAAAIRAETRRHLAVRGASAAAAGNG